MELVRELRIPTQKATTAQETYSQETEEQMEVTEADTEPEVERNEADQMRDTDVGSAAAETPPAAEVGFEPHPGWEQWDMQRRRMHKKRQREIQRRERRGDQGSLG